MIVCKPDLEIRVLRKNARGPVSAHLNYVATAAMFSARLMFMLFWQSPNELDELKVSQSVNKDKH